jgi:hypothetical protein
MMANQCGGSMDLHKRLIARQSDAELERKADKAWMRRGKLWTQEELDAADREADRLNACLHDAGQGAGE